MLGVPVWYFLFPPGVAPYVLKPCMERISDIIMTFRDTTPDSATGGMFTSVVSVDCSANGSICARMMADSRGAFDLGQPEPSAECSAQIPVVHWRGPFFCDEVGTCFRARPE